MALDAVAAAKSLPVCGSAPMVTEDEMVQHRGRIPANLSMMARSDAKKLLCDLYARVFLKVAGSTFQVQLGPDKLRWSLNDDGVYACIDITTVGKKKLPSKNAHVSLMYKGIAKYGLTVDELQTRMFAIKYAIPEETMPLTMCNFLNCFSVGRS